MAEFTLPAFDEFFAEGRGTGNFIGDGEGSSVDSPDLDRKKDRDVVWGVEGFGREDVER